MSGITKAEKYLVDQIRLGKNDAWSQLVDRYRGRLLNFARVKLTQRADAEDVVQETFIAFIKGLPAYRQDSGLESYLFSILRRKIVNTYRSKHAKNLCLIQDIYEPSAADKSSDAFSNLPGPEHTGSWYAGRNEQDDLLRQNLSQALLTLVNRYKTTLNFRDIQIIELLFYCQLSNKDAAKIMNIDKQSVSLLKHRSIKQIHKNLAKLKVHSKQLPQSFENLLTQAWEMQRPGCPKRSTIGAYLLETLDEDWHSYVDYHLNKLGCHFCRANLQDLERQNTENKAPRLHVRIMESTVGFLRKP